MNKRVRYTVNDVTNNRFYQMPKFLFEGEFKDLSNDARVLYSLLRDRHQLSLENQWVNDNNEVYLIYTRKNMEEMLGLADKTVKKAIDQLKFLGLLEEERMGLNKPNRIYLTSVNANFSGIVNSTIQETENLRLKKRKIYDSRNGEFTTQETENLRPNNTDINNTDINNTNLSIYPKKINDVTDGWIENYSLEIIRKKLEIEIMEQRDPLYTNLAVLIYDVLNDCSDTIRVNGQEKPSDTVKQRFLELKVKHLEYVVEVYNLQPQKIKNPRQYLITSLYNSPTTIDGYYQNVVNNEYSEQP